MCLYEQYGMHGIRALKKNIHFTNQDNVEALHFPLKSLQKCKKWITRRVNCRIELHTLESAFPQRKGRALHPCKKKRQGEDKSCQGRHSRTANVNIKMNREVNLGSVMAFQLVDLLQYFRNHSHQNSHPPCTLWDTYQATEITIKDIKRHYQQAQNSSFLVMTRIMKKHP